MQALASLVFAVHLFWLQDTRVAAVPVAGPVRDLPLFRAIDLGVLQPGRMNDRGDIAASGYNADGEWRAFLLKRIR